jgi:hypothetical protein
MDSSEIRLNTERERRFPRFSQRTQREHRGRSLEASSLYETFHVSTTLIITTSFIGS